MKLAGTVVHSLVKPEALIKMRLNDDLPGDVPTPSLGRGCALQLLATSFVSVNFSDLVKHPDTYVELEGGSNSLPAWLVLCGVTRAAVVSEHQCEDRAVNTRCCPAAARQHSACRK